MYHRAFRMTGLALLAAPLLSPAVSGQQVLTEEDYARAEMFLGSNTNRLVTGLRFSPTWISDDQFWFRSDSPEGSTFVLVNATDGSREPAFDHAAVASALSAATGQSFTASALPFAVFEYANSGESLSIALGQQTFTCGRTGGTCESAPTPRSGGRFGGGGGPPSVASPDGSMAAFIRDHNLWVRDVDSGGETRLTTDGIEDYGYATDNAGWTRSDRPVLVWSPDSKKIATFQHDARGVGDMYLVSTEVGHPTLEAWKYPLPEDSVIFRLRRVIVDVEQPRVVALDLPPDQHRSTICDHVRCGGTWADVEWSEDGSQVAFVSSSRDHKDAEFRVADAETGAVRDVFSEHEETFFESGHNSVSWRFLAETNEVIWYSQRTDWAHLYLYDLESGEVKNAITSGDWRVLDLERVDREDRTLYFTGAGREPGDPYFQYLYKVQMDGSGLELLTPDSANHSTSFSPSGEYIIDTYSTPVRPPTTVLRDLDGNVIATVQESDITALEAMGWQPPTPFVVKARDGVTDIHGLMYTPTDLDPTGSYPVLNYVYPGPQSGSVGSRSFSAARSDKQAIAELGFVVVELDAMGTPTRSKSFHEAYYGDMGDNGLPDQIAGIRQLAAEHSYMDLDRVGIWGHSGGGFAAAGAIFRYPDFYKVAVSQAGNHDNRNYEDDWGEKWQGLLVEQSDGTTNYDNQANQLQAENLTGKLLIAHGLMDSNVPPSSTLLVVNALIAANKDFDLIVFPDSRHGFGNTPYMMRRRWDYFVRHLLGAEPPREYAIGGGR